MNAGRGWLLFQSLRSFLNSRQGPLVSPRMGWGIGALVMLAWTALCAGAYGLVLLLGNWAITGASYGAGWNLEMVEFVSATLSILQSVGHVMVAVVWALVSLGILGVTWFLTSFRLNRAR